jgi:hypothetical protein
MIRSTCLTLIEQATSGIERLIESLLRYAQAGQGQLNRQPLAVEGVIELLLSDFVTP